MGKRSQKQHTGMTKNQRIKASIQCKKEERKKQAEQHAKFLAMVIKVKKEQMEKAARAQKI